MLEKLRKSIDGDVLYSIDPGCWQRIVVWNSRFLHAPMMFMLPANDSDTKNPPPCIIKMTGMGKAALPLLEERPLFHDPFVCFR